MDEVFRIAERIIVVRNGQNVVEGSVDDFDASSLSYYMTGKRQQIAPFDNAIDRQEVIFSCKGLRARDDTFRGVGFELYRGEVLGITGLLGSGRESLAEALFGIGLGREGEIRLCGAPLKISSPQEAVRAGIGYIPEDRAQKGLYLKASIADNIMSSVMFRYQKMGFLRRQKAARGRPRAERQPAHQVRRHRRRGGQPLRRQPAEGGHRQVARAEAETDHL